jgi:hypothetical protein
MWPFFHRALLKIFRVPSDSIMILTTTVRYESTESDRPDSTSDNLRRTQSSFDRQSAVWQDSTARIQTRQTTKNEPFKTPTETD